MFIFGSVDIVGLANKVRLVSHMIGLNLGTMFTIMIACLHLRVLDT